MQWLTAQPFPETVKLTRSAWKGKPASGDLHDYMLMMPERGVVVNFTSPRGSYTRWIVWGCRILLEPDSVAYTALENAKRWWRVTYHFEGEDLHWTNPGGGVTIWNPIAESEIPGDLRERGQKFQEKLLASTPPEYPGADP